MRTDRSSPAGELSSPEESPVRPRWSWRRSLRVKIIAWFFVPTALLLIAVAVTNFFAYQDVTAELVIERNQDVTRLSAGQLSTSLREFTDTLEEVGRGMDPSQPPGPSRFPAVQTLGRLSVFDGGVVVLDRLGTPLAARPESSAGAFEDWSSLRVFRELLVSPRPAFSNVLRAGTENRPIVAMGVPIVGARGELFGVTIGMFNVDATSVSALYGRIARLRLSQDGAVYLVDDVGKVIYHSATAFAGADFSNEAAVQEVLTSGVGALRTTSGAGEDIVAAYSPVPGTPWNLVSEASWSSLTSASRGYQRLLLALLAFGILAPIAIVGFGIHRLMRPVDELIAAARAVGAGDLSRRIESPSSDEIGVLAASFNQMTGQVSDRTRELKTLEELGRAIISGPSDASTLPEILSEQVPVMFPDSRIDIRIFPEQTLFRSRGDWSPVPTSAWEWLATISEAQHFLPGEIPPWDTQAADDALVVTPILDVETKEPIGGIHLSLRREPDAAPSLLPAVQSLAAQIASALHSAGVHAQELSHESVSRELALAGQIQATFLPDTLPDVPGWQLAAMLEPARETSGDFYDVIPLPNGRLGILIADVADKGMGAALYMAMSRTLIRTYAIEYETQPGLVLAAANHRILADTRASLFVTVFYGVLDPTSGELTYSNAGHNPPYLFSARDGNATQELDRTGVPLGILDGGSWQQKVVHLAPDDVLLLYTDGITEAQNATGDFFDEDRLLEVVRTNLRRSARDIQDSVIAQVDAFVGEAPQFDDITMMVVVRGSVQAD